VRIPTCSRQCIFTLEEFGGIKNLILAHAEGELVVPGAIWVTREKIDVDFMGCQEFRHTRDYLL
jgi:hypothetical protein